MRKTCWCKINLVMLCFSILLLTSIFSMKVSAEEKQEKTIRVGYPIQEGLTMQDENGKRSGYTYDYLMEISQYTGWNYEFIFLDGTMDEQLTLMMKMLEEGKIDIIGAMYYDEALTNIYSYTGYSYGINYSGLFVPEDSKLRESSLYNVKDIKVGVHSKSMSRNELLEQYAKMNNLNIEQVVTDTAEEFYRMIEEGKADALMSTDITMASHKNMFAVAHFSPKPFYFVTTKGNTDIIKKLDYAISTIDQVNPNFMVQLYNHYFSESSTEVLLSEEERNYLKNCGTLEVVMYDNKPPFQYIDSATKKPAGITVEILDYIAEETGLKLNYNTVSTYNDYISYVQSGKADIAADAMINYQDAKDLDSLLTLPWCELPISIVFQKEKDYSEFGKIAVPYFLKNIVDAADNVLYFDSIEQCLNAVKNGEVDTSFAGEFCSQYFLNNVAYSDLKKINNSGIENQKLSFGICKDNIDLLTIFNKGISSLPKETVDTIIYRKTYQQQPETIKTYLIKNRNILIISIMLIFTTALIIWFYIKERQRERVSFENKRYEAISSLANEYFYEYNMAADELILSEKCANFFNSEPIIHKFSRQLSDMKEEKVIGIWQIGEYIINNTEGSLELSCEMQDCSRQWIKIYSSNIENKKKEIHAVGKITNIQEIKAEQIRLEQQATIDSLTGIYNMVTIKSLIKDLLKGDELNTSCALLIIDLDNFKKINDSFGHYMGDVVLTQSAKLITAAFQDDLAGRLGGDEFILFVKDITKTELETRCKQLCRNMMEKTREMLGDSFTCSIGITWVEKGKSYETLYKESDTALYYTKEKTKNGYSFYQTDNCQD